MKQLLRAWRAGSTRVILALVHDNHLIGIFVDAPVGRYRIYNSLGPKHQGNDIVRDIMDTSVRIATAREPEFSWKLNSKRLKLAPEQKQNNAYDCGVFLLAAAQNWPNHNPMMLLQRDMGSYRSEWINRSAENHHDWRKSLIGREPLRVDQPDDADTIPLLSHPPVQQVGRTSVSDDGTYTNSTGSSLPIHHPDLVPSQSAQAHPSDRDLMLLPTRITAPIPRRSSRKCKESCAQCTRNCNVYDHKSPCGACILEGAEHVCHYISDDDKKLSRQLQHEFGPPCFGCRSRDFCDRESPCGCCDHLDIVCQYHPNTGKKAKTEQYQPQPSPQHLGDTRVMGSYDIEPPSNPPNALVSTKRSLAQSTESRKRPRPASDQMVTRAKGKLVAGSHPLPLTTDEDGIMECPANAYSSLATCPKRFLKPTSYEDIKRIRTYV